MYYFRTYYPDILIKYIKTLKKLNKNFEKRNKLYIFVKNLVK